MGTWQGRLALLAARAWILMGAAAWAGRPLSVDDADPVEPRRFELETGVGYERTGSCRHWDLPFGLACGLVEGLEAGVGFGGQFERRERVLEECGIAETESAHGPADLALSVKWRFVTCERVGGRYALVPSVKLPTADGDEELGSGETDGDLMWIGSWGLGERAGLHCNLGYTWVGGPDANLLHYGVALDFQVLDALQWVGEVLAERELQSTAQPVVQANTGVRWSLRENLVIDVAAGTRLSREAPRFTATAGLTWSFGQTEGGGQ